MRLKQTFVRKARKTAIFFIALWLFFLLNICLSAATNAHIEAAFSPSGESLQLILKGIDAAQKEILVAGYTFTSKPIAKTLLTAHQRGAEVRVVVDAKSNSGRYTAASFLSNHDVPVRSNGNYAIMHHKFMVIDGKHVQTGSFNYSAAATSRNAENVLMLWNMPELARKYAQEWQRLWKEAIPVAPKY